MSCLDCKSENIIQCNHYDDGRESFCNDCGSENVSTESEGINDTINTNTP
ncbi:MAG: hypothetical protein ACPHEO_04000 [Flavobacteriaceae bacterium]|jgi:hypothetical protein